MAARENVRYVMLDLARAGAIALLLLSHIALRVSSPLGRFFGIEGLYYVSLGGVAVTIFLFLSGIALELQYGANSFRYRDFLLKRCLRIYPVYYIALFIGLSVCVCSAYLQTGTIRSLFSTFGPSDPILSVTGFYAFAGRWGGPFMPASWFVGLIMVMYMIYPIVSRAIARTPHVTIVVLLLISLLFRLLLGRYFFLLLPTRPLDWFPLCRVFEFSLGIYAARILPTYIWSALDSTNRMRGPIAFVSRISFSLFLIDAPMWIMVVELLLPGVHPLLAIFVFLLTSILLSWLVTSVDQRVPRQRIFESITRHCNACTAGHAVPGGSLLY
jgi:peptidoglycan/LPS O-acetylase OafA/YrhL